ncbi:efflux RND transporter periplasmic adaptor subunit [Vibrio ostreae]|uniref:Efflux RND transporter periplasmic adaptor subunit n=1 Tax=Vibrio ostreae TaxID=2841925 RepID=A0A975YMH0_9VIBR|nr:efflux RND transporter periplasmic adaptor subunit [Vibrio ostreae]QXO16486.1 efflux RND transporter periplasmic adaptor subunit [Vibrio ostreae]
MSRHNILKIAIITALPLALTACGEEKQADPRTEAPLVRTVTIGASSAESRSFTGVIAARIESDLGFRVSGKVLKRLVDTGQVVKKGQVLMQLDPIDLQLAAHAQQEAVVAAKVRAKQVAEDEARYRKLRGTGAISDSAYDEVKAAADTAQAQLRAAQAQAEVAINATHYTDLVADADGTVVETLAEPGQVVSAGQIVVRVAHAGAREAVIQLPETLRPALGSPGQAHLFGRPDMTSVATLRQLSDAADPATRTFEARYVLNGALQNAPLGSTVTINVTNERSVSTTGLQVPIGALFDAGKGTGVWSVDGEPAKVSWHPVTVIDLDDDSALVSGSIQNGAQVVALGAHLLRDGEQVRVAVSSSGSVAEGSRP